MSSDYEKLGVFYLGREFDPAANALKDDWCSTTPRT